MTVPARRLARNVGYNLLGLAAPLVVGLVAIPLLIRGLGTERFGILTLAWAAIGYFSLFDLGMGRALTQALSAASATGREQDAAAITRTALVMMTAFGVLGGVLLAGASPWLVTSALRIPAGLQAETVSAFRLLALSLPVVVTTVGLRGVLEAYQDFGIATALRMPYAIFTFAGPLLVLPFSRSLVPVVGILVVARVLLWLAHAIVVRRRYARLSTGPRFSTAHVASLLRMGGWMTVSNVVSPLMVNIDRFLIAGMIGTAAVAHYVTPYEVATKLLILPAAMLGVLFPAFASTFATDPAATGHRAGQAIRLLLAGLFPLVLALVALAPEGLRVWVGKEFAVASSAALQWLAAGVLINAVGYVPFTMLQGIGRSDLTAKLHLAELPIYFVVLLLLARELGVTGVAIAWTLRVALDTAVLLVLAQRSGGPAAPRATGISALMLVLLAALAVTGATDAVLPRLALAGGIVAIFVAFAWARLLRPSERSLLWALRRAKAV